MAEEFNLDSYFAKLDAEKKELANEQAAKDEAAEEERRKKSAFDKFNRFINGADVGELKEFTEEELTLMASMDNADNLTIDDEGHVVRIKDSFGNTSGNQTSTLKDSGIRAIKFARPDKQQSQAIEQKKDTNKKKNIAAADIEEDEDEPKDPEARRRREALRRALSASDDDDAELDVLPIGEAEIRDIETMSSAEAKLYVATAANEETGEAAFGFYLEQGTGPHKMVRVDGERFVNVKKNAMSYLGAAQGLYSFSVASGGILKITIFATREIAFNLFQNGWEVRAGNEFTDSAALYSQTFTLCAEQGIKIGIVFMKADADEYGLQFAQNIADALVASS